jgi:bacterioferritin-associated ferredoxin
MYICLCNGITEGQIRSCAQEGVCTLRELESCLGVGVSCGKCRQAAGEVLEAACSDSTATLAGAPA